MQKLSPNAPVLSVMVVQSLIIDGETSSTVPHVRGLHPLRLLIVRYVSPPSSPSHQHPSMVQLRSSLLS